MPDADQRRSLSPDLNPFDAFIGDRHYSDSEGGHDAADNADGLVPTQQPSIIDERAVVRYYRDGSITPIIISAGLQGTVRDAPESSQQAEYYDVALALDMTRGCGGKIWPAAEVLGAYIASRRIDGRWRRKTAVELGAGTGLVGLLAAAMGDLEAVYITDQEPMLKLMEQNLALNAGLRDRCIVEELNWGEAVPSSVPAHPDILLLADCVYLEVAFQPLVDTMVAMSTPQTEILFCYQQRRKADKRFFKMLQKHFTFVDVDDDDKDRQRIYTREGTHLYRVVKKK